MKLLGLFLILRDVDAVNRHPLSRLEKLTQFSEQMLNKWFKRLPSKDAWIRKFGDNSDRLKLNFERGNQRCSFYDPTRLPHGGLTEEEIVKHAEVVRQRQEQRKLRGRRSLQNEELLLDSIDELDGLNSFFEKLDATSGKDRYNRDDAMIAIRQICGGFRQWSRRYMGKCSGQRVHQHQTRRMNKWQDSLRAHYRKYQIFNEREV